MTVKVRFSYPYRKLVGKDEVELEVNGSTKVRELLRMVAERHPGFKEYADKGSDEQMSTHMVILLQDRVLRLEDAVEPGMTIQLMAPIAGGQKSDKTLPAGREGETYSIPFQITIVE